MMQRAMRGGSLLPGIDELGYRLGPHDIPAASMLVLSFAMEPGRVEAEEGGYGEGYEGEEYQGECGYVWPQYEGESVGQGQLGDQYRSRYEDERMYEGEGHSEGTGQPTRGRWKKSQKPHLPYTVTCALCKTNWFESSMEWENTDFRTVYRMSKETFWAMVDVLKTNTIFQSKGHKNQRPVHYQLGMFLLRYGIAGSHIQHPKLLTSIGEGTVVLYCCRVIRVIREHGLECVVWPTEERKQEIKHGFKKICRLDNIIGSLDGTLHGLESKPRIAGDSYVSRKKTLSVNVQAVVDHEGSFIAFQSGWAGSRPDVAIWPHMKVYQERTHQFAPGEFLLADGGYPVSPYVLIPFTRNELDAGGDGQRRHDFNHKISQAWVVVKWAFGRAVQDMKDIYWAIEVMMVVHNMCHRFGDVPDDSHTQHDEGELTGDLDTDVEDGLDEVDERDENVDVLRAGREFRLRCVDIICPS
ncbi:hypothetical protein FRC10_003552 [Ceratobasidium sp. 414]|nr:hypothetical protein FRC10_003552 [Ceratobasidium sp. 414]